MRHRSTSRPLTRRAALLGSSALALAPFLAPPAARAQISGTQTEGNLRPRPVAVVVLADDPALANDLTTIIATDLERSGLFQPIDPNSFIEHPRDLNQTPRFPDWRSIGAEALVVGRAQASGDGRIRAEVRIWDVTQGRPLGGRPFAIPQQTYRRVGHILADQTYELFTGEKGYFDTRVVYIDETGPKDRRIKRLAIMDQDGFNVRLLSQGKNLVLTPRFNPVSQEIAFMSYVNEQPRVFLMNLESLQQGMAGEFPGTTFAPRFSPDGQRLLMSLQQGGGAGLVELDLRSRRIRQITSNDVAIDTGPCYDPQGRQIVFESDRDGGVQQLFLMSADGGGARRISVGDGRYSTPVWSPRGDYIAFTKQAGGRFLIGVMFPDGTGERILTEGFHNEGPTWAPNGRVLMFFRDGQGPKAGPKLFSVDLTGYNERPVPTPAYASDPAWSPSLS